MSITSVLLDLDGTLLDTAPDLGQALNTVLIKNGKPALPLETIRPSVSFGASALVKLGFSLTENSSEFEPLRQQLLEVYQNNISEHTTLFPGYEIVLASLERRKIPWGIVTNKPERFTQPLTKALSLDKRAACIVSGDTIEHSKPHPAPLIHACKIMQTAVEDSIYIGDSLRDIEAGNRANMKTLVAAFGYLAKDDQPHQWQASGIINTPEEILEWV